MTPTQGFTIGYQHQPQDDAHRHDEDEGPSPAQSQRTAVTEGAHERDEEEAENGTEAPDHGHERHGHAQLQQDGADEGRLGRVAQLDAAHGGAQSDQLYFGFPLLSTYVLEHTHTHSTVCTVL